MIRNSNSTKYLGRYANDLYMSRGSKSYTIYLDEIYTIYQEVENLKKILKRKISI